MSKIGVFGGTFNPPHLAHKRLVLEAARAAELEKVIVIPANVPPHKMAENLLDADERLKLCRLTFFEDIFEISDIEIKREGKSYTVDTLRQLKTLYPDDELYLIIGSDMLLSFQRWVKFDEILRLSKLIVTTRENEISNEMLYEHAEKMLSLKRQDIVVLNLEAKVLSSTEVRACIKNGEPTDEMLTAQTAEYINKKGFYR